MTIFCKKSQYFAWQTASNVMLFQYRTLLMTLTTLWATSTAWNSLFVMTASDRCPWYGNCNLIQHLLLIFYADPLTRFLNPESSCSSYILGSPSTHLWQKLTKVLQSTCQEGNHTGHYSINLGHKSTKKSLTCRNGHLWLVAINFKINIELFQEKKLPVS